MIETTLFKSAYDTETNNRISFVGFSNFESWLYKLSKVPLIKPNKGEYIKSYHAPLISPAVYEKPISDKEEDKITRKNDNVVKWAGWAALDVDDFEGTINDINTNGFYCVVYSTASSTEEHIKFRMVFPLTQDVYKEDLEDFWYALNRIMGSVGDAQVKDMSRMYYIPAHYPNAYNFIKTIKGEKIDPKTLIRDYPKPYNRDENNLFSVLSPEMQKEMLSIKMEGLTKDYKWTSYRNCPFVNKELVLEYKQIIGTGWYHKLYSIMVSIASRAFQMNYPITASEIANLASEIHLETRGWPTKRKLIKEAERAIDFSIGNI